MPLKVYTHKNKAGFVSKKDEWTLFVHKFVTICELFLRYGTVSVVVLLSVWFAGVAIYRLNHAVVSFLVFENTSMSNGTHAENVIEQHSQNSFYYGLDEPIDRRRALIAGMERQTTGFLTIGIPTIRRQNASYYLATIRSLIANIAPEDLGNVTIVVMLADFNEKVRKSQLEELSYFFSNSIDNRFLRVIQAPKSFYPSFNNLRRAYGHSERRTRWRSKQNYDYAFLMKYSVTVSQYYMQLEDDVVTVVNYTTRIKEGIRRHGDKWVCIEYSQLGFIGKLYGSNQINKLASMLMLFFQDQPPDVTYLYFNRIYGQAVPIIHVPTIFQHMGYYSSLVGKIEPLKDKLFIDSAITTVASNSTQTTR